MTRTARTLVALVMLVIASGLLPTAVFAAAPTAVDDPGGPCAVQPPGAFGGSYPIPEDWHGAPAFDGWYQQICGVLENDSDPDNDPLTWAPVDQPSHGDLVKIDETSFAYKPDPDWSTIAGDQPGGDWVSDSFTYRASDGTDESNLATYRIWVMPINDPPTFTAGSNVTANPDDGAYSANWATNVSSGPANESGQTVHFTVQTADTSLFSQQPAISASGRLTFRPKNNAVGLTNVTVRAVDDGGMEDYGLPASDIDLPDDTSDPVTFQIVITASLLPIAVDDTATVNEDANTTTINVLGNDSDSNDTLTVVSVTDPAHGTAAVSADDLSVTYKPDANYHGTDTFDYTIQGGTDQATATVAMTVTSVEDMPVAVDDNLTVAEDASATAVDVLTNDSDGDGDPLTIISVANPAKGTATIDPDSQGLHYTPDPNAYGSDSFNYRISDGKGHEDLGTVHVTITASQDPPVAVDDNATMLEDAGPTAVDVLANDSDPDGDTITVTSKTNGAKGTVAIDPDDLGVTYDPNTNANGTDAFTYTINDGHGHPVTATVHVTITAQNDNPVADDDSATMLEDAAATAIPVLTGDTDPDGDTLTITGKTNGSKGVVTITGGGTGLTYKPNLNANGADTFTYTVSDGHGGTDTADVDVTITAVNDDPVAATDSITVLEDAIATAVPVLTNDTDVEGDTIVIDTATDGAKGTVVVTGGGTGLTYKPNKDANGTDTFTYAIKDGHGGTATGTVNVTITPQNDPPTADNDVLTINEDAAAIAVPVLFGDADIDGDTLTITAKTNGAKGVVTITGGGTGLTYKPNLNANGADSFTYTISDGHGGTATATVNVTINPVNDKPVASGDSVTVAKNAAATAVAVLANDTDVEGDTLTITAKTNGTKGVVTITGGGSGLTYRPYTGFSGPDSFTYTVSDGHGGTAIGTVTVTITGPNTAPSAVNDGSMTVPEGAPATALAVLANDSDPDGDTLKITAVTNGKLGTVAITGGGTGLTYDPAPLKKGTDTFTYTVSDGRGGTDSATVLVTVTPDTAKPVISALTWQILTGTLGSQVKLRLAWAASDPGSGIKSYGLQRSLNSAAYATIGPPAASATSYDWSLTPSSLYRFRIRATDKENNVSSYVSWPNATATLYQESSTLVTYTGTWSTSTNASMSGGKGRYIGLATARAKLTFTGRDVAWVATKTTGSGKAGVYIDGVYQRTIDLKAATATQYKQIVYAKHFADNVAHTLEIRPVGTGRVDVDAFIVVR